MNILHRVCWPTVLALLLGGCVSWSYSIVPAGTRQVGDLELSVAGNWNAVPEIVAPYARKGAAVWTREGVLLDRFWVIPGVPDGEAIFRQSDESVALPVFHADMLANELAELTESSIVKLLGEGETIVSTENLRPHRFGDKQGVLFDFQASLSEGPRYRGVVGAFTREQNLYMLMYLAVEPYYFDKNFDEALAQIQSARLSIG